MLLGTTENRTISPDEARTMLQSFAYERQRKLNKQTVAYYAKLMRLGHWLPGGEMILAHVRNGADNKANTYLVDGQHRLAAVVESGVNIQFRLTHNHCDSEQEVATLYGIIDTNKGRNINDYINALRLDEELGFSRDDNSKIGSAVSFVQNSFVVAGKYASSPSEKIDGIRAYSVAASKYLELIAGGVRTYHAYMRQIACMGVGLVTLDEATRVYGDNLIEQFWGGVAHDSELKPTDPRKTAIRHIVDTLMLVSKKGQRSSPQFSSRYIANCFNAWIEGRELAYTRVPDASAPILIVGTSFRGR